MSPPAQSPDSAPGSQPGAAALRLGYAGLIPFVAGAALVWLVHPPADIFVTAALSAYAGVIVSFLGGIHWGFGFAQRSASLGPYAWGVAPSLVAWIATTMPAYAGLVIHGAMLVVCYLVDRKRYPHYGAAAWLTLRFRLSTIASLSCFLAAAGALPAA